MRETREEYAARHSALATDVGDRARRTQQAVSDVLGIGDMSRNEVRRMSAARAHGYTSPEEDSETHVMSTPIIQTTTSHSENTPVNHPVHYNADPSGVECIQIIRHRNHNIGAAIKYLWRAGLKVLGTKSAREAEIQDLEKAVWYIQDEITRLKDLP